MDENFPTVDGLEWLIENTDDVVVESLMIREFGPDADASVYGELVREVKGPEYCWTDLRAAHIRGLQK